MPCLHLRCRAPPPPGTPPPPRAATPHGTWLPICVTTRQSASFEGELLCYRAPPPPPRRCLLELLGMPWHISSLTTPPGPCRWIAAAARGSPGLDLERFNSWERSLSIFDHRGSKTQYEWVSYSGVLTPILVYT
jgi:hypothetical protein